MVRALSKVWWAFLIRGIVAILFGLMLWFRPGLSLAALVMFFGAWMLVDGVFTIFSSIANRKANADWGWMLVGGIMSALLGVLTLRAPGLTAIVLILYIAVWAIMLGIGQIALGWRIRKEIEDEWMLFLGGTLALLFGISILWNPGAGAFGILWMIAFFSVLFGLSLVILSFRLKGLVGKLDKAVDEVKTAVKDRIAGR
jgi:uncharacterized membrane protein HdeD (DUF308 family)